MSGALKWGGGGGGGCSIQEAGCNLSMLLRKSHVFVWSTSTPALALITQSLLTSLSALTCTSPLFHPEIYFVYFACSEACAGSASVVPHELLWTFCRLYMRRPDRESSLWRLHPDIQPLQRKCLSESSFREQGARWLIYNVIIMLLLI